MAIERRDLQEEWRKLAPAWIKQAREGTNASRIGLLDSPILTACGDVRGRRVLDCGCGEGRFCRMLLRLGAEHVLGLDLCPPMIEAAQELASDRDAYRVADVQDMSFLPEGSFDLVVSYLNQCDLRDFEANNREVYRVLRSGGRFIVANLHPMRSAVGGWQRTPEGTKQHVILDHYFDESERHWEMLGVKFTNFHRTLATYVSAYNRAGFAIQDIIEPTLTAEALDQFPELDDELRVPNFIIIALTKLSER